MGHILGEGVEVDCRDAGDYSGGMDSRSAKGGLSARRMPRRIFDIFDLPPQE